MLYIVSALLIKKVVVDSFIFPKAREAGADSFASGEKTQRIMFHWNMEH